MSDVESLSREDLIRLLKRANFVKEQQATRIGAVLSENLELLGVVQEQAAEIEDLRGRLAIFTESINTPEQPGEVPS